MTKGRGVRWGPFILGRRCKHAAAELGDIYEAVHAETGAPSLVMIPKPGSTWHPRRNWRKSTYVQAFPPLLGMSMEESPATARLSELTEAENLLLAAIDAVGHDVRMRLHLTRGLLSWRKWWPVLMGLALTGLLLLVLGGCVGWLSRGRAVDAIEPVSVAVDSEKDAPKFAARAVQDPAVIAYPLPNKPFKSQARAPCPPERDEAEINGGCWVVLERRPPCLSDQAEYKGKCYLPVASDQGPRLPQSVSP
ncbi:hypothetical protein [Melittangium boletus]|nr:hypothetical protein [Melittangium boletus]